MPELLAEYLDNAATSLPKAPGVVDAMVGASTYGNAGRATHSLAAQADTLTWRVREQTARYFGLEDPSCVIFTCSATMALNLALLGILQPGDHVVSMVLHQRTSKLV
jgi:selenocysteine lyase/cysteine desulfurase